MKKLLKSIMILVNLTILLGFISCSNSSDSSATSQPPTDSPNTPTTTPSTDNPNTPTTTPEPSQNKYTWIFTESETTINTNDSNSSASEKRDYSQYNSKNDYKYTSITKTSNIEYKITCTISSNSNVIKENRLRYDKNGSDWVLKQETESEYYKYAFYLTKKYHIKTLPYTINGVDIPGSESNTENTIESLGTENEIEKYKVISNTGSYNIYEFKNGLIQKYSNYSSDNIKSYETVYSKPNNSVLNNNIPDYVLTHTSTYDTTGNKLTESLENLEDVEYKADTIVIKTKITQTSSSGTSITNSTYTYKKKEIPFSNE